MEYWTLSSRFLRTMNATRGAWNYTRLQHRLAQVVIEDHEKKNTNAVGAMPQPSTTNGLATPPALVKIKYDERDR